MSLLDTASLIVTSNGYKEGKLYSVIPSDGSGDMSVTRSTTATRVNSAGLVELVPYNLLTWSENLTLWNQLNEIASTQLVANPLTGLNNATKVTKTTGGGDPYIGQIQNAGNGTYTNSVYLWTDSGQPLDVTLFMYNSSVSEVYTLAVTLTTTPTRYNFTSTFASTGGTITVRIDLTGSSANQYIYVYGAQLNEGTLKPYQKTETRLNIPRLDYSNGTCPSLLVEPQRTNLALWSSSLDNAAYTKAQYGTGTISVTANYGLAPDGTMTADRVQMTQGNFASELFQRPSTTAGQTYTVSFWVKSLSGTPTLYTLFDNSLYQNPITFTSEWVRYEYTYTAVFATSGFNLITFTGLSGTSASADILVWGVQHEQGSYATSYIPTTSASVTRNADVISKTGISSLIGTEFTVFLDAHESFGASSRYLVLKGSGGTYANAVFLEANASNQIALTVLNNSSATVFGALSSALTSGQRFKLAVRCKNNDFAFYVNGVQVATQASGSVPTTSDLYLGYYSDYSDNYNTINSAAIWPTALTNAQLATLTTI